MYLLLNNETEETLEISTEAAESIVSETSEAVSTAETKEPWPEGGVDAFKNDALPSLVFGMLGIFIVLGLIALATMALNKLFPGNKN